MEIRARNDEPGGAAGLKDRAINARLPKGATAEGRGCQTAHLPERARANYEGSAEQPSGDAEVSRVASRIALSSPLDRAPVGSRALRQPRLLAVAPFGSRAVAVAPFAVSISG